MNALNYLLVFALLASSGLSAQTQKPAPNLPVSQMLDFWITVTEEKVVSAVDAMPGDKYSFAPSNGEFTGVRTFGQQAKHLAANNYRMAAYILNRQPTIEQESETGPASIQSKTQIVDYVKGSFVALHEAVATIDEHNMTTQILAPSTRQKTRLQLAEDVVAHSFDHYGQMVVYLRMNGIVPPASH